MSSVNTSVADAATGIAKLIGDPILIVLTIVIIALIAMLFLLMRWMNKKDCKHQEVILKLTSELHENSQTLVRLATFIEVLIHGRNQT